MKVKEFKSYEGLKRNSICITSGLAAFFDDSETVEILTGTFVEE